MKVDLGEDEQTEIGFAPLIDCVFLLLIFFLVATSFKQEETKEEQLELEIDLPVSSASMSQNGASNAPIIISVDKYGNFFWQEKEVSTQELHDHLRRAAQISTDRRIRVDGDRQTPYQNIVHVLDLCQFEGFTNIGMHTLN